MICSTCHKNLYQLYKEKKYIKKEFLECPDCHCIYGFKTNPNCFYMLNNTIVNFLKNGYPNVKDNLFYYKEKEYEIKKLLFSELSDCVFQELFTNWKHLKLNYKNGNLQKYDEIENNYNKSNTTIEEKLFFKKLIDDIVKEYYPKEKKIEDWNFTLKYFYKYLKLDIDNNNENIEQILDKKLEDWLIDFCKENDIIDYRRRNKEFIIDYILKNNSNQNALYFDTYLKCKNHYYSMMKSN